VQTTKQSKKRVEISSCKNDDATTMRLKSAFRPTAKYGTVETDADVDIEPRGMGGSNCLYI
jgi:hypothetical protein